MGYYSGIDRTSNLLISSAEIERARADGINIVEMIREEGYDVGWGGTESILDIFDEGGHRKHYGEFAGLWQKIAPYVNEGSIVYFCGEGGDQWRIVFGAGTAFEQDGRVVYS